MSLISAYIVTFIASFCILVIEIVAGRILAPFVGVSLYTWTSIIGVVLAGISIGAYLGGRLADRFPQRKTLGWLLLLSGMATLLVPPVTNLVATYHFPVSLMARILIVTVITFFIPSCVLGMISPVVVRLAISNVEGMGRIVGKIYAVSTLGSILGTFATGFLFISWMGTRNIILVMGCTLIATAVLWGSVFKSRKPAVGFLLLPALLLWAAYDVAFKPPLKAETYYYKESDYYTIKVSKALGADQKTPLEALILDNLTHSFVNLRDPLHIEYKYERIYGEVLRWRFGREAGLRSLTIGGGGYTFPRYMEISYPSAQIDVVEIDPDITKIVYQYLGLPQDTKIRTYNTDGRWYVMNCKDRYDVIFVDAYNDLTIPYHLTTREFARQLKDILKPGGILLTNIIDNFQKGAFLPSYIRTLREVFGTTSVRLISISPNFQETGISTFIVMAGGPDLDLGSFESYLKNSIGDEATSVVAPETMVTEFLTARHSVVLTDDYAPVDNLVAPIFEERFGYKKR